MTLTTSPRYHASGGVWKRTGHADVPAGASPSTTRGALAIGTASYAIPTSGTVVYADVANGSDNNPGTLAAPYGSVAKAVAVLAAASGGTVIPRAGVYHESFQTNSGNAAVTVQAYPNEAVWFDGSVQLTTWTASGAVWVHNGIPTKFYRSSTGGGWSTLSTGSATLTTRAQADLSDQVFYDGNPLTQVADGATPAAGQFAVDYTANTITIGNDPTGHEVRVSDLRYLCVQSSKVNWKGVGVRRYSPDSTNAVNSPIYLGGTSAGSVLENVFIERSAMAAVGVYKPDVVLRNCTFQNNQWTGPMGDKADRVLVQNCVESGNNVGLFKPAPQAAGTKFTRCIGLTYDNNWVHDNNGANGLWIDVTVIQFQITNNLITGNHGTAIVLEESDGGLVNGVQYRSVVAGNVIDGPSFGIQCDVTGNTDFYNNRFTNCSQAYVIIQNDRTWTSDYPAGNPGMCPGNAANNTLANNIFGPSTTLPVAKVRYFDQLAANTADALGGLMKSNLFADTSGSLIQWGSGKNTYASYSSVSAAASAHPSTLVNNQQGASMLDSAAEPMPANVAAALGQATGTKHIGPYITSTP